MAQWLSLAHNLLFYPVYGNKTIWRRLEAVRPEQVGPLSCPSRHPYLRADAPGRLAGTDFGAVRTMKRMKRKPEAAAGYLALCMGMACLGIAAFSSLSPNRRLSSAVTALMALSWGVKEVAAARKWKCEPEEKHEATSIQDRLESERFEKMEKSGSMANVLNLLGWFVWSVAALSIVGLVYLMLFRHER
jgi:hypothetical protein